MFKRKHSILRALGAPLVLVVPALSMAEVDTSEWACESCPFDQGYRAKVSAGAARPRSPQ